MTRKIKRILLVVICLLFSAFGGKIQGADAAPPKGGATIRGAFGGSEIVIKTTDRVAGAIDSLTWNGVEFIDSFDHGRQLQSASNFGLGGSNFAETFNPTEAGSRDDGRGPRSSSRLISIKAVGNVLETKSRMAFWLAPGEKSSGNPARNQTILSNHLLYKKVQIGFEDMPNVLDYRVVFTVPRGERHDFATFEALTGYMPDRFRRFWRFDAQTRKLTPIEPRGEQADPVAVSDESGKFAMGVFSPDEPSAGFENAGYGCFRFPEARVNKWNCVFRVRDSAGIKPGDYTYRMFVTVGTRDDVERGIAALRVRFAGKAAGSS